MQLTTMPCVASAESVDTSAMAVCTVCYLDPVTDKTFEHVATSLHMEYILHEYKSLSDAWKLFQGINIYRTYLGVTAIPYQSEKAPRTCSVCLVKIIELAKASYVITRTYKAGYEQKEKSGLGGQRQPQNINQTSSPTHENTPKEKSSKERWSICPSKKVATVHPNPASTQSRQLLESPHCPQSTSFSSMREAAGIGASPSIVSPPLLVSCLASAGPGNLSQSTSKEANLRNRGENSSKEKNKEIAQTVTATSSQRPRRSRGRSLFERNPDFLVNVPSGSDVGSKTKKAVPNIDLKSHKTSNVEPVNQANFELPSSKLIKPKVDKSPRKYSPTSPIQKYSEKYSKTLPSPKRHQILAFDVSAQTSTSKILQQNSTKSQTVRSNLTKRSRSISSDSLPRPKRSGGRSLMDRHPDFLLDTKPFKTKTNPAVTPTNTVPTVSSGLSRGTVAATNTNSHEGERSLSIKSKDTLPKWRTSQFRSKQLSLLDKALSSVGWGQKHRNAKNMEQEVFENAQSEEAYISKMSRLVVYFSSGYQPLNSPSAESPNSIIGIQNKHQEALVQTSENLGIKKAKRTKGRTRQLLSACENSIGTQPILKVVPIEEGKTDEIMEIIEEVATGKHGFIERSKASPDKLDKKSSSIVKTVRKSARDGRVKIKCNICGKQFYKGSLKNHILNSHSDNQFFPCKICRIKFPVMEELERHLECDHPNADLLLTSGSESSISETFVSMESSKDTKRSSRSQYQYVLKTGKNGKQGRRYYRIQCEAMNEEIIEKKKNVYPEKEPVLCDQKTKTRKETTARTLSVKKASLPEKAVLSPSKPQAAKDLKEPEVDNVSLEEALEKRPGKLSERKPGGKSWWDINQETEFE